MHSEGQAERIKETAWTSYPAKNRGGGRQTYLLDLVHDGLVERRGVLERVICMNEEK
jgi:hypothetical protein